MRHPARAHTRRRLARTLAAVLAGLALAGVARPAAAQTTLAQNQNTVGASGDATFFVGQSVTTPTGGPFTNLTFNFYSNAATNPTPAAAGTLFILTQAYAGTPSALSSTTAGYLAQSTGIVGGVYQFAPGVTLAGATQYFFYANAQVTNSGCNVNCYAGGNVYVSEASTTNFANLATADADFRLAGTASTTAPEPATWALLGAGLLAVGGVARRRRTSIA